MSQTLRRRSLPPLELITSRQAPEVSQVLIHTKTTHSPLSLLHAHRRRQQYYQSSHMAQYTSGCVASLSLAQPHALHHGSANDSIQWYHFFSLDTSHPLLTMWFAVFKSAFTTSSRTSTDGASRSSGTKHTHRHERVIRSSVHST